MDELRLSVLGRLRIEWGGRPLAALSAAKAKALLVYLAVTALPHSRQALAGLLWPEVPEAAARSSLRSVLSQLNEVVAGYIVATRAGVALQEDAPLWVDARVFEAACYNLHNQSLPLVADERARLRATMHLYHSDFLDDFNVAGAEPFEEWLLWQRQHYRQLALNAFERLTADALTRSALDEGIEDSRRMLALDSAHEVAHRQMMTLLALSGQRTAALAHFEKCRTILETELGVEPEATTIALAEEIRMGRFGAMAVALPVSAEVPPASPALPSFLNAATQPMPVEATSFVAREAELARLFVFLDGAHKGPGQVLLLTGQAGSGKSALLREFARHAQERYPHLLVAHGLCNFFTGVGEPYLPFREIMAMLTGEVDALWTSGAIGRDHAQRLWKVLPAAISALALEAPGLIDTFVTGAKLAERAAAHEGVDPPLLLRLQEAIVQLRGKNLEQQRLFEAYTAFVQRLSASQPLLLILDDLQWADASSLSMLFHLARRLAHGHILIVAAYRPEDTEPNGDSQPSPLQELITELEGQYRDCLINLDEIGAAEERRFVDALVDAEPNRLDSAFRQALLRQARGHALFTTELLRDLQERGVLRRDLLGFWVETGQITWESMPARVESLIEKRLRRLDTELREALSVASVEGEEFTAELVAHILAIDERTFIRRLARLHRQPALVTAQRVLHSGIQRLSKYRFGHNLFQRYLYSSLDAVERVYLHEAVALELERLYGDQTDEIAVQLAQHFESAGFVEKAVSYWRKAGESAAKVYANAEAIAAFSHSLNLIKQALASPAQGAASQLKAPPLYAHLSDLYTRLGRMLEIDSHYERALAVYQEMALMGQSHHDRALELAALIAQATLFVTYNPQQDWGRAEGVLVEALTLARSLENESAEARILWNLLYLYSSTGRMAQALDFGQRSLAMARKLDLREQIAYTLADLGNHIYFQCSEVEKARTVLIEALAIWQELDNQPLLTDTLSALSLVHVYTTEYQQAIARSDEAFLRSQRIGTLWGQCYSRIKIGYVHWQLGQIDSALVRMQEGLHFSELSGFTAPQVLTRGDLARLYADLGQLGRGLEQAELALVAAESLNLPFHASALGTLAYLYLLSGDPARAEATIERGKRAPTRISHPVWYSPVSLAEAALALQQADYGRLHEVCATLILLRERGIAFEAILLQSRALLATGQAETAQALLLDTYQEAETLAMQWPLWRIAALLSQVATDPRQRQAHRQHAQDALAAIIETIPLDLRPTFVSLADVKALLA